MLKIDFTRDAMKFIEGLQPKQAKQVMVKVLHLSKDPEPNDSEILQGTKEGYRRADIGEYRIVYRVASDTLEIYVIAKRNDDDVYKEFEKKLKHKA